MYLNLWPPICIQERSGLMIIKLSNTNFVLILEKHPITSYDISTKYSILIGRFWSMSMKLLLKRFMTQTVRPGDSINFKTLKLNYKCKTFIYWPGNRLYEIQVHLCKLDNFLNTYIYLYMNKILQITYVNSRSPKSINKLLFYYFC